ncbi:sensor histidine kinase [Polycladidibacter hongkongensis]|uniref:sensor histidine kinase n=1 Tax=Polycladidibacter hongkongensis TaxID=1647556 RepID=UPI00082C4922|nr:ATP-binding protein [Pseudovibrio hongkongensis]
MSNLPAEKTQPQDRRLGRGYFAALAISSLLVCTVVSLWLADRYYLGVLLERKAAILTVQTANLQNLLDKYRLLPPLLARRADLISIVQQEDAAAALQATRVIAGMSGAEEVVISSFLSDFFMSNQPGFSTGSASRRFYDADAPAIQAARQGRLGRDTVFLSDGTPASYVFAAPIRRKQKIVGVLALRVSLAELEQTWALTRNALVAVGPDGQVVASNRVKWRQGVIPFRSFEKDAARKLGVSVPASGPPTQSAFGRFKGEEQGGPEWLKLSKELPVIGWRVDMYSSTKEAHQQALKTTVAIVLSFLVLQVVIWQVLERRWRLLARLKANRDAAVVLEKTVQARTADLLAANKRLGEEVAERKATEKELQHAQAGLVQSAKLATLGEMSAALSHEFNQPLGAIRTYADNADQFLKMGKVEKVEKNLGRIVAMVERMAAISKTLKGFTRKAGRDLDIVPVDLIIDEVMLLAGPRLKSMAVDLQIRRSDAGLFVLAGQVRLTQVLMNLVGNALDALKGRHGAELRIEVSSFDEKVRICVLDNGPGIDPTTAQHVFDPFFTTKAVGEGLGLGLSIAYKIIKDVGGELSFNNVSGGGACFVIELQRAYEREGMKWE